MISWFSNIIATPKYKKIILITFSTDQSYTLKDIKKMFSIIYHMISDILNSLKSWEICDLQFKFNITHTYEIIFVEMQVKLKLKLWEKQLQSVSLFIFR